jgi:hypothetical protein
LSKVNPKTQELSDLGIAQGICVKPNAFYLTQMRLFKVRFTQLAIQVTYGKSEVQALVEMPNTKVP